MLESDELNCISAFARVVDRSPQIRAKIANAPTIEDVVSIAHSFGHCEISTKLLIKAAKVLRSSEWVWEESGSRWTNYVFSLALAMITESIPAKYQDLHCADNSKPIIYNDFEAQVFYEYALTNQDFQKKLTNARSIQEVVLIAKNEGFRLRKIDFVIREREWRDHFFPWAEMEFRKASEFLHREELEIPPPSLEST